MSFGFAGAAAGSSDAMIADLTRRYAEQIQAQQMAMRAQESKRQDEELALRQKEFATTQGNHKAQIALTTMRPGAVSDAQAGALKGTDYESMLDQQKTLPSTSQVGDLASGTMAQSQDAGGQGFSVLRPTQAQEQAAGQTEARRRVVDLFKRGAPRNEILGGLADAGENITGAMLTDPQATINAQNDRAAADRDMRLQIANLGAQGQASSRDLANQLRLMQIEALRQKNDDAAKTHADQAAGVATGRATVRNLAQSLIEDPALNSITGPIEGRRDTFIQGQNVDALRRLNQMIGSLTLEARGKMKGQGQISDFEGRLLAGAVSAIDRAAGPEIVKKHLQEIVDAFQGDTPAEGPRGVGQPQPSHGAAPAPTGRVKVLSITEVP